MDRLFFASRPPRIQAFTRKICKLRKTGILQYDTQYKVAHPMAPKINLSEFFTLPPGPSSHICAPRPYSLFDVEVLFFAIRPPSIQAFTRKICKLRKAGIVQYDAQYKVAHQMAPKLNSSEFFTLPPGLSSHICAPRPCSLFDFEVLFFAIRPHRIQAFTRKIYKLRKTGILQYDAQYKVAHPMAPKLNSTEFFTLPPGLSSHICAPRPYSLFDVHLVQQATSYSSIHQKDMQTP